MGTIQRWFSRATLVNKGKQAENAACHYLQLQGLKLITRNFRWRLGEIDLIMRHDNALVFVEVRSRSRNDFGESHESINIFKRKRIIQTAQYYLQKQPQSWYDEIRIDVVAIDKKEKINWIQNAFDLDSYNNVF